MDDSHGVAGALIPGGTVGNYTLVQKLRDGGMASLFLAKRSGVHGFTRPVAIKVVHAHLSGQSEFVQMFVDEALLSSHLNHPNIVHVEEFGELADGRCFLAMEYIDGCSLSEYSRYLRKQKQSGASPAVVAHLGSKIAEALHAAHEAEDASGQSLCVVHRDVSPGNILLSRRGHVKVVDFGIAKSVLRNDHTVESLKGKLRYMSPEQARGHDLDPRTDVYSLGLVLWELLAGRRVFSAKRDLALLDEVREPKIAAPSTVAPNIPPALDAAILKAVAPNVEDRFETAMDFSRALREAVEGNVEASDIAAVVAEVPQRNVDRVTMTSGSLGTGLGTGSGSRTIETRVASRRASPVAHQVKPLGVPSEFPLAIDVPLPAEPTQPPAQKKLYAILGVAGALLVVLLAVLVMGGDDAAAAGPGTQPTEVPSTAVAPSRAAAPSEAPTEAAPPVVGNPAAAPAEAPSPMFGAVVPEARPSNRWRARRRRPTRMTSPMAAQPAPSQTAMVRTARAGDVVLATGDDAVQRSAPMAGRRVGMTLLADDDEAARPSRTQPGQSGTRVRGGILLAD